MGENWSSNLSPFHELANQFCSVKTSLCPAESNHTFHQLCATENLTFHYLLGPELPAEGSAHALLSRGRVQEASWRGVDAGWKVGTEKEASQDPKQTLVSTENTQADVFFNVSAFSISKMEPMTIFFLTARFYRKS